MAKKNKKKTIKIVFPEAKGNYWRVVWIREVHYERMLRKIEVYFCNKDTVDDDKFDPNVLYRTKIVVSSLSELGIGSVYNVEKKKFEDLNLSEVFSFNIEEPLFLAKKIEFPINGVKDFLLDASEIIPIGFNFLKTFGESNYRKRHILISPYTILQYFLFYNDGLITKTLSGKLLEGFKLSEIKYNNCEETGELIGMLRYDADKLSKNEAAIIAPYLFLKDHVGIKFLNSISSHVENAFSNSFKGNKSAYPSFYWQGFRNYKVSVVGKSYYKDSKKYLLAYRICNFTFNDLEPYIVDKIELFPFNQKNSTKDRENHEPENVDRPANPIIEGISLTLNADSASPAQPLSTLENEQILTPFNIRVDIIERDEQLSAYNVNNLPNNQQIESLTRELENLEINSNNIIENIETIIKASNFEYFNLLVEILEKEYLSEDPKFQLKLHDYSITKDSFLVAEVLYQSKAIYFVEFGSGFIGVFTSDTLNRLETEYVYSLVKDFIAKADMIEKGKVLWTYIKDQFERGRDSYYESKGIIIHMGVKHQKKSIRGTAINETETLKIAVRRTAKIIFETRIKRILT